MAQLHREQFEKRMRRTEWVKASNDQIADSIMPRNTAYTTIGSTSSGTKRVHLEQNKEGKSYGYA